MAQLRLKQIYETLIEAGLTPQSIRGDWQDSTSCRIVCDSRQMQVGDLFVAQKGATVDSHDFINDELISKAAAILYENPQFDGRFPRSIRIERARSAISWLAAAAFDHPERELQILGVTGTNGKTSSCWLIHSCLELLGKRTLYIGTLGVVGLSNSEEGLHTTPDPWSLFRILAKARDEGIQYVALEVSSHALDQDRLGPIRCCAVGFTSLSRDHLDYHKTMQHYIDSKLRLLQHYRKPSALCFVARQVVAQIPPEQLQVPFVCYGLNASGEAEVDLDIKAVIEHQQAHVSRVQVTDGVGTRTGELPFFVSYAIENFVLALAMVEASTGDRLVPESWNQLAPIPGRLELVVTAEQALVQLPTMLVDYAHSPDSLEQTLLSLRPFTASKLWCVFGCGGDRDRGKRSLMGAIAMQWADAIVLTSDNPRSEDPEAIIDDIEQGLHSLTEGKTKAKLVYRESDRRQAIHLAASLADKNDVILVAGKGHETYQEIMGERRHFDDREVCRCALKDRQALALTDNLE